MSCFGAALAAILVRPGFPSPHLEGDSKDVLRLVLGFITTLTAMVLSLLISSGYSAYQFQKAELQQLGVHIDQIDRALADFGPDTIGLRGRFREMIAATITRVWPADDDRRRSAFARSQCVEPMDQGPIAELNEDTESAMKLGTAQGGPRYAYETLYLAIRRRHARCARLCG
jgi:hypothetical protein